ncbi:MAG: TraR/DksA C4-type zinc finger protein [Thermodesulfobacteriota bacterium]
MRNDIDQESLRKRLEERLEVLKEELAAQKKDTAPRELDQACVGRLSRMDAMQQQAMGQAASRLLGQERERIRTALSRMDSEEYGYCILCDDEIAEKRLGFDPSLLTCIDCASAAEKG